MVRWASAGSGHRRVIDRTTAGPRWSSMPRSDSVEALVPAGGVQVLVFGGPTAMDAIRLMGTYGRGEADRYTRPSRSSFTWRTSSSDWYGFRTMRYCWVFRKVFRFSVFA